MKELFKFFFDFKSRVNRKDFLIAIMGYYCFWIIFILISRSGDKGLVEMLKFFMGIMNILTLSFCVRRLHDFGYSGWWLLAALPLFAYFPNTAHFIIGGLLFVIPGNPNENQFGKPVAESFLISLLRITGR